MIRKIRQVNSKVATAMPEIGFDEEPISPVRRDDTVANRKPKTRISSAPRKFMCSGVANVITAMMDRQPMMTHFRGISWSVRKVELFLTPLPMPFRPADRLRQIMGMARTSEIRPPAATAPAPMYST